MSARSPLLPIFCIVLVDVLGFTIVIPLMPFYAERFGATPLVATALVSVYAVCSLISTPIIGKLSDDHGRRKLLMASQAGTFLGFAIIATANSLWMVFVGRVLDGLTAGNLSVAQAYISDHTAPENRAKAFGVIGIAFGIGFMLGPALGGVLGDKSPHLPFIVAAGLSAFSIVCTYLLLPREQARRGSGGDGPAGRRPSPFDWRTYAKYFGLPHLRALYTQFFLFSFAFSAFFSGFALFSHHNSDFLWGPDEVGYLFAYAGFLGILIQGGLLGRMVKRVGEYRLTLIAFALSVVAYMTLGTATSVAMLVVGTTISAFGHGVSRPVLTSRMSRAVGRDEQGTVLGISGSLGSIAMAAAPPTGGFFLDRYEQGHGWLVAWAMVPAGVSLLALFVTLIWPGHTPEGVAATGEPPRAT